MNATPSQRWSSAVHDLFACVRGRLPAAFLERKLAELGLAAVKPLQTADLPQFDKAVDLVNAVIAGRPAPGGLKPDAAIIAAFPEDHPTLGPLRVLAQDYVASMRPAKAADKGRKPLDVLPERGGRQDRQDRPDRQERFARPDRAPRPAAPPVRPPPPPRPPRITWEQWLERHLGPQAPGTPASAAPVVDAAVPAADAAPVAAVTADGAAAAPAPVAAPVPAAAPAVYVPPVLANWPVDAEARRHFVRIRDRVNAVIAAKADPAAALRELAFAILRPPQIVRDDLRALIAEHLQQQGVVVTTSALYPPPPVAALKRDWENLLAARGPADPAVEGAWRKLITAHPEARAKLEAERTQELDDLLRRFAAALRDGGEQDARTGEIRAHIEARHANAAERIAAELARFHAAAEAAAATGRLIAERGWEDAEAIAAIAALDRIDPGARQRLESQRRHERDELDRRLRTACREQGPDHEATQAALKHLAARFPTEGAAAAARLDRIRRGEDLAQQEKERREAGRSLSAVHLATTEHRLPRLHAAPRWRLVIAVAGVRPAAPGREARDAKEVKETKDAKDAKDAKEAKDGREGRNNRPRRNGHAVGWLIAGACEHGPVPAGWRAADSGSLDELDACVQAVADRAGGVIGLALTDCPERAGAWADAAWTLTALVAAALPVANACELAVELPAWAEVEDVAALDAALTALGTTLSANGRTVRVTRAAAGDDHAASLAEAVAWTWGGRKDADSARLRQSGLAGACLLQPTPALRESLAQVGAGNLPAWPVWSALLAEAAAEPEGLAEALLARVHERLTTQPEAITALHRHLTGMARGRIADPARLARELAWLDGVAAALRPRERLRLAGATFAAQAAAGRIAPATTERLAALLAELREDWPAEVLEAALHAAVQAREAIDAETAETLLAPWARAEAVACGGRTQLVRLCEERARIAASTGRWKDARKHLDRGIEAAARCADPSDRDALGLRLAALRAAVLSDDPATNEDDLRAALLAVTAGVEPGTVAARVAVDGVPRPVHAALLRWMVRRQDEALSAAYLAQRTTWSEPREGAVTISALRAVLLAAADAPAAVALLTDASTRAGDAASAADRLSLAACAVAAALRGAVLPDLRDRLAVLRRDRPTAAPAVAALERALALAPDVAAGLAEALPLLAR